MRKLPHILRELRDEIGLTQTKVADIILVSTGAYAAYEEGRSEPRPTTLIRLAALYEIQPSEILQVFYPEEFEGQEPPNLDLKRSKALYDAQKAIQSIEASITTLRQNPLLK